LLVVDSDPAVHALLGHALKRDDCRIEDAYDGHEALDLLRSLPADVVVAGSDGNGCEGVALLPRVRALRPNARVIVAGRCDPAGVVGAIRERAYSYFHKPLTPGPVADMVQQALDARFWKDDIRVISARPEWITLEIRSKMDVAERTTQFLREIQADLPVAVRDDTSAAIRELLMNAIEHGAHSDPKKRVRVALLRTGKSLIVHMQDPGPGFSLDALPHAAISNPAGAPTQHVEVRECQGQRPGGFGILMVRSLVDELVYNERGNAVLFVKYL